jgi:signal transduction histidine kinase
LRGPIATMRGIINLGIMEAQDEKSIKYFDTLQNVSHNFNNVLSRLIEVHETYQIKPVLDYLDPRSEIAETADRLSKFSIDTSLTFETELNAGGQWNSDRVLFNVIIENMIRNAICYKDKKDPTIKIKTEYQDNNLRIVIEDNGFGIEPRDEAKVFNIFFKGSPKPGGTGLEIYTAKIAVEKLNGVIRLQKARKNTIFEIILPPLNK